MSQFSNQLQTSMEDCGFTQTFMYEKTGLSQGSISRYANGESRPDLATFDKICTLFPKPHQTRLLLAWVEDEVPESKRGLVSITPAGTPGAARVAEDPPAFRSRMPRKLRTAYDGLGAAALEKPRVAQALITTWEMLKANG